MLGMALTATASRPVRRKCGSILEGDEGREESLVV